MNKIRILRLIARMNVGGPAIQITGLMCNLPHETFDQRLVTGYCDKSEIDYIEVNNIDLAHTKIEGFGRGVNLLSDFKALIAIRREIQDFNPHIIHTHTAKAGFLGRIASILTFRRQIRVHTFHGHLLHGYFGKMKTLFVILAERILALLTHRLIAVGEQVRDELLDARIGNSNKYHVIGPGIKIGKLPERILSLNSLRLPEDKFIVTWIGRAVTVKAPFRILEIAKECVQRNLNVEFVLVGEGPLLDDLRDSARKLQLPVTFLGWQSDIEKILSVSNLVMLTSENEGTPVALIQAQMAGIPVLTTDVGSASEVVIDQRSGFCIEYSPKTFADKIELLEKSVEKRTSLGTYGKIHAEEKFSVYRLVSDHAALYSNLVSRANS